MVKAGSLCKLLNSTSCEFVLPQNLDASDVLTSSETCSLNASAQITDDPPRKKARTTDDCTTTDKQAAKNLSYVNVIKKLLPLALYTD